MFFFFSSRRRHTRCALVTGVQTCALPISGSIRCDGARARLSLAGQSGQERLDLSIDATGHYVADARIAEPDPALEPTLSALGFVRVPGGRSEEHTSELQSLMRISYAVFCLKKKKKNTHQRSHDQSAHT